MPRSKVCKRRAKTLLLTLSLLGLSVANNGCDPATVAGIMTAVASSIQSVGSVVQTFSQLGASSPRRIERRGVAVGQEGAATEFAGELAPRRRGDGTLFEGENQAPINSAELTRQIRESADERPANGALADERPANGALANEAPANGTLANEAPANGTLANGAPANGTLANDGRRAVEGSREAAVRATVAANRAASRAASRSANRAAAASFAAF